VYVSVQPLGKHPEQVRKGQKNRQIQAARTAIGTIKRKDGRKRTVTDDAGIKWGGKSASVTDYITLQTWWIRKAWWWAKCLLCMSKRFLRCHERHSKACRHDRWVTKLRLLLRSEAVLLFMLLLLVN